MVVRTRINPWNYTNITIYQRNNSVSDKEVEAEAFHLLDDDCDENIDIEL